jgi:hypothetical protein
MPRAGASARGNGPTRGRVFRDLTFAARRRPAPGGRDGPHRTANWDLRYGKWRLASAPRKASLRPGLTAPRRRGAAAPARSAGRAGRTAGRRRSGPRSRRRRRNTGTMSRFDADAVSASRSNRMPLATKKTGMKNPNPAASSLPRKSGWLIRRSRSTIETSIPAMNVPRITSSPSASATAAKPANSTNAARTRIWARRVLETQQVGDRRRGDDQLAERRCDLPAVLEHRHQHPERGRAQDDRDQQRRVDEAAGAQAQPDDHGDAERQREAGGAQAEHAAAKRVELDLQTGEEQHEGQAEQRKDLDRLVELHESE